MFRAEDDERNGQETGLSEMILFSPRSCSIFSLITVTRPAVRTTAPVRNGTKPPGQTQPARPAPPPKHGWRAGIGALSSPEADAGEVRCLCQAGSTL